MTAYKEEIFGPVLCVVRVKSIDEGIFYSFEELNSLIKIDGEMVLLSLQVVALMEEDFNQKLKLDKLELMFLFQFLYQCSHSLEIKFIFIN